MAIDKYFLRTAVRTLRNVQKKYNERVTVATLGYPDLMVSETDLRSVGVEPKNLEVRERFVDTSLHVKLRAKLEADGTKNLYTTESFFDQFNMDIKVFDIYSHLGVEEIIDLNEPLPEKYKGKYKMIFDVGTLEHCFNVGVAFKNIMQMTEVGGTIFMAAPASKINHGFWNFCPTAYTDIFHQNEWTVKDLIGVKGTRRLGVDDNLDFFIPDPENRKSYPSKPEEVIIMCVAEKDKEVDFKYPLQMKYAKDQLRKTLYIELKEKYEKTKKTTVIDGERLYEYEDMPSKG